MFLFSQVASLFLSVVAPVSGTTSLSSSCWNIRPGPPSSPQRWCLPALANQRRYRESKKRWRRRLRRTKSGVSAALPCLPGSLACCLLLLQLHADYDCTGDGLYVTLNIIHVGGGDKYDKNPAQVCHGVLQTQSKWTQCK